MSRFHSMLTISTILLLASSSFANEKKGISPIDLKGDELKIVRSAYKKKGHFLGLKGKGELRYFKITECSFSYEKGLNTHPQSSREYKFERFMINFSGVDKNGENSFDSVTYGHSNYKKEFVGLDFSKSFGFKNITRVELPPGEGVSKIKATRNELGELSMTFRHKEAYSTGNSSFFVRGENRDYSVKIAFSRFDKKQIKLDEVKVKAMQRLPLGSRKATTLVDVVCSNFKEEQED